MNYQLVRFLALAAVVAAFFVPSGVWAHEGHNHHPAPVVATAARPAPDDAATRKAPPVQVVVSLAADAALNSIASGGCAPTDCGSHCCGVAAGMACCGAALVPDTLWLPALLGSARLVIPRMPPLPGLPPEALPKPPK
jgi:hypothetical protein